MTHDNAWPRPLLWTTLVVGAALCLYWQAFAKKRFAGPARPTEEALRSLEAQFASTEN